MLKIQIKDLLEYLERLVRMKFEIENVALKMYYLSDTAYEFANQITYEIENCEKSIIDLVLTAEKRVTPKSEMEEWVDENVNKK